MGFAGQVFAARMAVGLAVPSAGALSRTGSMLAKGASGIYSALAAKRKDAAVKRVKESQEEVNKLKKLSEKSSKTTSEVIAKNAADGMRRLEVAGKRGAAALRTGGASAFSGMKSVMGKEGNQLFKGLEKATTPLQKLMKMTQNFSKMSDGSQKRAVKQSKEYVIAKKEEVKTAKELLKHALKEKADAAGKKKVDVDEIKRIDKRIKRRTKLLESSRRLRNEAIDEAEVIRSVSVQAWAADSEVMEKNTKISEDLKKATEDLTEAEGELATITDEVATESRDFGAAVVDTVNTGIKNYQEVLLETVAAMTAFYYKLNQNTEAMMEFERELLNANSVWQQTNEVMFAAGEQVTQFGQTFGLEMQNGATGLYQLASAGLTADESMTVLSETLKLSMAVQGDHNTIAKLTTQTLKGFDMEMSQAGEVTDKFAHAIQKSLIEYEDLGSAVKFALPFFTSTGQSIDQLLGSLQILTNRALEAGIAGRGLRQALAEFAEGAEDNDRAFRKLGINILNAEGEMRQLTEIAAEFAAVVGEETITNTELLTTLIDDLNVRGATAFVHLVQASDEFTEAVEETAAAGGELDKMVKVQNESLTAQIQILKNNVQGIFQMTDATYTAIGYQNEFHMVVSQMIADLQGLIVEGEDGSKTLTDFGLAIRDIAVAGMQALREVIMQIIPVIKDFSQEGFLNVEMLRLYTLPLRLLVDLLAIAGPYWTKMLMTFYIMNKILPITTALEIIRNIVMLYYLKIMASAVTVNTSYNVVSLTGLAIKAKEIAVMLVIISIHNFNTLSIWGMTYAQVAWNAAFYIGIGLLILVAYYIGKAIVQSETWAAFIDHLTEPGGTFYRWISALQRVYEIVAAIASIIGSAAQGVSGLIGSAVGMVTGLGGGKATGGYLTPMQSGGYLVGERGPELFRPNGGGQLLNNTSTNHIMSQSADSGFSGGGGNMTVTSLTVESAEMNQSNLNIDSFAGNPAMKQGKKIMGQGRFG